MPWGAIAGTIGNIGNIIEGVTSLPVIGDKIEEALGGGREPNATTQQPAPPAPGTSTSPVVMGDTGYYGGGQMPIAQAGAGLLAPIAQVGARTLPQIARRALPWLGAAGGALALLPGGAPPPRRVPIRPILDKARRNTGVAMTSKKLRYLVSSFGAGPVMAWTGLDEGELMLVLDRARRRRMRMTRRDRGRARSYLRSLVRARDELNELTGRGGAHRRRRSPVGGSTTSIIKA